MFSNFTGCPVCANVSSVSPHVPATIAIFQNVSSLVIDWTLALHDTLDHLGLSSKEDALEYLFHQSQALRRVRPFTKLDGSSCEGLPVISSELPSRTSPCESRW